jgi:hypothetical protein
MSTHASHHPSLSGAAWRYHVSIFILSTLGAIAIPITLIPRDNTLDYPVALITALRILAGERPYLDFVALYGPIGHYITAALLGFTTGVTPALAFNAILVIFVEIYIIIIGREVILNVRANFFMSFILLWYLAVILPIVCNLAFYSLLPTLFLILSILVANKVFGSSAENRQERFCEMLLAALIVITLFTRLNFGIYIAAAVTATSVVGVCVHNRNAAKIFFNIFGISLLFFLIAIGVMYAGGVGAAYVEDTLIYLSRYSSRRMPLNFVPWPQFFKIAIILFSLIALVVHYLKKTAIHGALFASILAIPLLEYAIFRLDVEHVYPLLLIVPFFFLRDTAVAKDAASKNEAIGAPILATLSQYGHKWCRPSIVLPMLILVTATRLFPDLSQGYFINASKYWLGAPADRTTFVVRNHILTTNEEARIAEVLVDYIASGDSVFVGGAPGNCESTIHYCTNIAMYLLIQQLPVGRVWFFDTAITPYADNQERLVHDLDRLRIKWVLMQGAINSTAEHLGDNQIEATIFGKYVEKQFAVAQQFHIPSHNRLFLLYRRKDFI